MAVGATDPHRRARDASTGCPYRDLGPDFFERKDEQKTVQKLTQRLASLGYEVGAPARCLTRTTPRRCPIRSQFLGSVAPPAGHLAAPGYASGQPNPRRPARRLRAPIEHPRTQLHELARTNRVQKPKQNQ